MSGRIVIRSNFTKAPEPRKIIIIRPNPNANKYNKRTSGGIVFTPGDPPKRCSTCLTEGSVVNCSSGDYLFRCTVCDHQWGERR